MDVKLVSGVFTSDTGKQFSTGKKTLLKLNVQEKNIMDGNCYFPETILKQF